MLWGHRKVIHSVPVRLCLIDRPIQLPRKRCDTEAIKSELTRIFFNDSTRGRGEKGGCRSAGRNLSTPLACQPTLAPGSYRRLKIEIKETGRSIKRSAGENRSKNATR